MTSGDGSAIEGMDLSSLIQLRAIQDGLVVCEAAPLDKTRSTSLPIPCSSHGVHTLVVSPLLVGFHCVTTTTTTPLDQAQSSDGAITTFTVSPLTSGASPLLLSSWVATLVGSIVIVFLANFFAFIH